MSARDRLVALLQLAYSGERAAALAYYGHWNSVKRTEEREHIRRIEDEEWRHREHVGEMLAALGSGPDPTRERRAALIGRTLAALCHLGGWLAPMYGAGKLESRNVREYETAARHARDCGRTEWIDALLTMAEVEWDHEHYFRQRVLEHPIGKRLPLWKAPPPRETIRSSFAAESGPEVRFEGATG